MHGRGMFANAVGSSRFLALEALVHSLVLFLERPALRLRLCRSNKVYRHVDRETPKNLF